MVVRNQLTVTALAIGIVSLSLFLAGIGKPRGYVFDEFDYVSSARAFLNGAENPNPQHPPLAKLLIAASIKVMGDNPFGWRVPGAICGSMTLVAIFLWTYLLLHDYGLALTATGLAIFNNFLFVMSRVAMLDVFYFAFVIWGILAFTAAIKLDLDVLQRRMLIVCAGLMFGLGGACKWNAVVTLAAVALVAGVLFFRKSYNLREIGAASLGLGLVAVPVLAYCLAYWPLFYELHRRFTVGELVAMNSFIWQYHVHCPGNPGLHVPWYDWFFRAAPERALSWLMGNFVVAWGGLVGLVICAWKFWKKPALAEGLVVLFYAVNVLQWVVIPQKRTCYYYYYPPIMFLGIALVVAISGAQKRSIFGARISLLMLIAAAVFFLFCYPRMAYLEAPFDCALGCWS